MALARRVGLSAFHLRSLERSGGNPHADTLGAISEALGCDVDELFRANPRWKPRA